MMLYDPAPTIFVDYAPDRPSKRCRLEPPEHDQTFWIAADARHEPLNGDTKTEAEAPLPTTNSSVHVDLPGPGTEDLVCYGMIVDLPITKPSRTPIAHNLVAEPVILVFRNTVQRYAGGQTLGQLDDYAAEVLATLAGDSDIELQLRCSIDAEAGKTQSKKAVGSLEVILYGLRNRAGHVGDFVGKCGYYLQDPSGCTRNVIYLNPQRLTSLDGYLPMTFDLEQYQPYAVDDLRAANDILANFETTDTLKQAETPRALRTQLQVHQKQALSFLKRRDLGLNTSGESFDIWSQNADGTGGYVYFNTISEQAQSDPPPIWRGGLLADDMGLGKTLTMIALIASDLDSGTGHFRPCSLRNHQMIESTLVVVPPNGRIGLLGAPQRKALTRYGIVLQVWESQLREHVHTDKIKWIQHHGKSRFDPTRHARQPDIVFATYQTIEYEFRKSPKSSVSSFHWKRIVLDEAHVIRNWKTSTAKAVASLNATSRWTMSGTPIQNNLADFFGLFNFLRFHPYDDQAMFDKDLCMLWRNKPAEEAAERFKKLLSCVMIRRHKATTAVGLPPKYDKAISIPFDPDEEAYYRNLERPVTGFDAMDSLRSDTGKLWVNIMQRINQLRMTCNLGLAASSSSRTPGEPVLLGTEALSENLGIRFLMGDTMCDQCFGLINLSGSGPGLVGEHVPSVYYSRCFRVFCSNCANILEFRTPESCACEGQASSCVLQPVSLAYLSPRVTPIEGSASPESYQQNTWRFSSKVRALLAEIRAAPIEKNVVFSYWTSSLDMVQEALQASGIPCVRIDGKVTPNNRKRLLDQFKSDPSVRVLLMTVSCGAVGLDLTAASSVHMLEPQWNPSLEQQAMDRVYRIGQMRPVTTLRYIMKDSIEEHIRNVQDRKKLLSTLLLSHNVDGS